MANKHETPHTAGSSYNTPAFGRLTDSAIKSGLVLMHIINRDTCPDEIDRLIQRVRDLVHEGQAATTGQALAIIKNDLYEARRTSTNPSPAPRQREYT